MHPAEFVASYIDAWNQQDCQAIANHLADNGTYLDNPLQQQMSRQEFIEHLDELFKLETNVYELVGEVLASDKTIAFQYKALPRETGATAGEEDIWYGAEFITMRSGAAVEIVDYYEQHSHQPQHSPLARATGSGQVQRYAKSGLNAQQMDTVKCHLGELMDADRLYLQSNLTLPELAELLDCTVNHLSQVINAGFGMSFFDYLNQYRVKQAMLMLGRESEEPQTVLDVALGVGFNSTSTFYAAFKKVTGKTPAQYRRERTEAEDTATSP